MEWLRATPTDFAIKPNVESNSNKYQINEGENSLKSRPEDKPADACFES